MQENVIFNAPQQGAPQQGGGGGLQFHTSSYAAPGQGGGHGGAASGSMNTSSVFAGQMSFDDEPPLLEELGINFDHIWTKTKLVLHPKRCVDSHIMDDTDLAGPLFFGLLLGFTLMLTGKLHFGYIYGIGAIGCLAIYGLLNLMSEQGIDISRTVSVLGYCLLPIVGLSVANVVLTALQITVKQTMTVVLGSACIFWCTYIASLMFVNVLGMNEQRLLVAYPVGLVYTCFALITVF